MQTPSNLPPYALTILIDSREKLPLTFPGFKTEFATLEIGDYTIKGLHEHLGAERKSKKDLLNCLHHEPHRLNYQLKRLNALPTKLLVIEANAFDLERDNWPHLKGLTPSDIAAFLQKWQVRGLPIELAGTHERASAHVLQFLIEAASAYYQTHRAFFEAINEAIAHGDGSSLTLSHKRAA
jgi:DNA excision repair protein ERCC-4